MSRLSEALRVAPSTGVALSTLTALVAGSAFLVVKSEIPVPGRIAAGIAIGLLVFTYGFLVSYVYGDARRRGMRHVVWTLVAAFVPNALGFIAYFLLREPLLQPCTSCGATARRDFAFCPQCGAPLPRTCPSCRRPVETSWSHCAHCGKSIPGATPTPSPVAQS
jgi:Double zinc ribbon